MDPSTEWADAQARVIQLVAAAPDPEIAVPACPEWSVRQLLAHMVGLDADALAGDEPEDHNATWTQRQVDQRADHDVATIVEEWRSLTEPVVAYIRDQDPRPLGDVVIHEQDLRSALGQPGARDTAGLAAVRDLIAERLAQALHDAGQPALAFESDDWSQVLGDGMPGATLRASTFDLTRAMMSRRSTEQLTGWCIEGDIEPYLPFFAGLGPLPETELPE